MRHFLWTLVIVTAIGLFFFYGVESALPHRDNPFAQRDAVIFGFFSALAWGLSIIGSHVGARLTFISDARWNSIFNFFAAGLAATAVGYTYIPLSAS
jgi:hypothetical protein